VNENKPQWWARFLPTIAISLFALVFPTASTQAQPSIPKSVTDIQGSDQVVLVQAPNWKSTSGTLRAFEKRGTTWVEVVPAVTAILGSGGLVRGNERIQGTGKTPTGTYAIVSAFGTKRNPGSKLPYKKVKEHDAWTYNPKVPSTYNIFQTTKKSWKSYGRFVERLNYYGVQYNYSLVLDFNLPQGKITTGVDGIRRTSEPANTQRGGGIFLHVTNGKKTAGCIAVKQSVMKDLLQWLEPSRDPVIHIEVT